MTFITGRGEGQGKTKKERKATKRKGRGLEEGASRALMRQHGVIPIMITPPTSLAKIKKFSTKLWTLLRRCIPRSNRENPPQFDALFGLAARELEAEDEAR